MFKIVNKFNGTENTIEIYTISKTPIYRHFKNKFGEIYDFTSDFPVGDAHDFENEKDFLQNLVNKNSDIIKKYMLDNAKVYFPNTAIRNFANRTFTIVDRDSEREEVYYKDEDAQEAFVRKIHKKIDDGFFVNLPLQEQVSIFKKLGIGLIAPLFVFKFGDNITISDKPYQDIWASSRTGLIFIDKKSIVSKYKIFDDSTCLIALEQIKKEMTHYNEVLDSTSFSFKIFNQLNELFIEINGLSTIDELINTILRYYGPIYHKYIKDQIYAAHLETKKE